MTASKIGNKAPAVGAASIVYPSPNGHDFCWQPEAAHCYYGAVGIIEFEGAPSIDQ
ncbi:MAG: hypothetical protein RI516_00765 [Spiribacter sp.]|nr:hypothetical protein [Spiribacter sp.]